MISALLAIFITILFYINHQKIASSKIAKLLITYSAVDQNGPINLMRHGKENDGGYVVPEKAFQKADVLLGYGIDTDASFEMWFSDIYKKPSYGFDCGVDFIGGNNKLFTFINECVANEKFIYPGQISSGRIYSFDDQLVRLDLNNKKIFIKMDIEGAEYDAFYDVLQHADKITGIVLEIHFTHAYQEPKAIKLLSEINKKFLLIHLHANNCAIDTAYSIKEIDGMIPKILELSYINKSLVTNFTVAKDQSHPLKIDMPNCPDGRDMRFNVLVDRIRH